jgi:hypothetical protein
VRLLALVLLLAAPLVVGGCGGSKAAEPAPPPASPPPQPVAQAAAAKPPRIYTKAELARLVLQPKDSPADMRYLKDESGQKTLEAIGLIVPSQIRELRSYGFRGVRDAVFGARAPKSDRRVAERVWLMKSAALAKRWLQKSKDDSVGLGFSELRASALGDESWAVEGQASGGVVITHAFRLGNAVFVVTSYSAQEPPSPAAARAAAVAALARARKV